jgi:hypothetical protein
MHTTGLDLHKRESQPHVGQEDGTVEERRIVTSQRAFHGRPRQSSARLHLARGQYGERVGRAAPGSLGRDVIVQIRMSRRCYATRPDLHDTNRRRRFATPPPRFRKNN